MCSLLFSLVQMHRSLMVSAAASPTESRGSWKTIVNGWAFSATASRFLFSSGWKNNPTWLSHLSLAEVYLSLFLPFLLHYCPASLKNGLSFTVHKVTHCLRRHGISLASFPCSDYFFSSPVSKFQELSLHEEQPANQQWDHDFLVDFLQLEIPHPWS